MGTISDAEKEESIVETLYRMVSSGNKFFRSDQRRIRDWLRSKVQENPDLLAAAGIPEEDARKIQHEVYLFWRWKGVEPTGENMPEVGWSIEKHIDLLCEALATYSRSQCGGEGDESRKV